MQQFIFGGDNMPKTPQELARLRAVAEAMTPRRTPQNVGEGIASIGNAILYRSLMNKADKGETAGIKSAEDAYSSLFSAPDVAPSDTAAVPPIDATATIPPIASPQDAVDASPMKPLTGDLAQTEALIRKTAAELKMDPDIAVRVARSEGLAPGVWQSRVKKGDMYEPSYGAFQMLFGDGKNFPKGMGNDFMDKTGLDPRDPKNHNEMIKFALQTAKKDGWRQWYGAKKVGVNRWDGVNVDQVASLDSNVPASAMVDPAQEQVPVVPVPDGFQQPDPLAMQQQEQQPVEVADNSNYFPPAPRKKVAQALSRLDPQKAYEVLNNPYLPEGRKETIRALLRQQFEAENMAREQELKQADPKYQLDLEKGRLEIGALKNPPKSRTLTDAEEKERGLNTAGVYQIDKNDNITTVQAPKDDIKPPSDVMEYEYAQKQGYKGTFQQWQLDNKKASAAQTSVTIGEGDKFYENLDKKNAETFAAMSDGGIQARAKLGQIDRLEALFTNAPQGVEGAMKKIAGDWGIATEGLSDIQAAGALLERMVPAQRTPGSGPMSDADIKMFRAALPRLLNQPGGNQLIFQTLRGIATYETQMGEIADMVADRAITPAEGRKRVRELANPLAEIKMPEGPTPNEGWTEIMPGVRVRKKAD
jgi:hypothetical protein